MRLAVDETDARKNWSALSEYFLKQSEHSSRVTMQVEYPPGPLPTA
jgi:hypothetical protein